MNLGKIRILVVLFLGINFILSTPLIGADKKSEATSGKITARQKKLLAWKNDWPDSYAVDQADFFVRGTVIDFKEVPKSKEWEIVILPLEVLSNPNHYVTMDHFKNGLTLRLALHSSEVKQLKKGGIVEYNHYSKEIPGKQTGHAKLVATENHTEFRPYDVAPIAYLTNPGLEPEQIHNAIRGILLYNGEIQVDENLKKRLAALSKNPKIAADAKKLSNKLFGN